MANYENQKDAIDTRKWIEVRKVKDTEKVMDLLDLLDSLDPGEAEAIILAQELKADYLVMDERKGRKVAENLGLKIIGLLGILIEGKKKGHLGQLKPVLDKLSTRLGSG